MQQWEEANMSSDGNKKVKVNFVKFSPDATLIRILSDVPYGRYNHWIPNQNSSLVCQGKDCVVCEVNKAAKKNGEDEPYGNGKKYAVYIFNHNTKVIEIWDFGQKIFNNILVLMADRKEDGNEKEFDLRIRKQKDGTLTIKDLDGTEIDSETMQEFATYPPISERFVHLDRSEMTAYISGTALKDIFASKTDIPVDSGMILG